MSKKVKNRKNIFKPIVKIGDNSCIVRWDYKPLTKLNKNGVEVETPLATWQEESFNHIPSLDEIKSVILGYYNTLVEEKIICGFSWNNMKVWLSTENQFNYKAAYDLAIQTNGDNLPIVMKFGDIENPIYYTFNTINELKDFYISSMKHIQDSLKEGWKIKDSIDWEKYF